MFGTVNRRSNATNNQSSYDFRLFSTTDARQYAFDDLHVIATSQSGLAGLMPLHVCVIAAQTPSGFDYTTNFLGLGGTPRPVDVPQPLINQPQFALSFLEDQHYV